MKTAKPFTQNATLNESLPRIAAHPWLRWRIKRLRFVPARSAMLLSVTFNQAWMILGLKRRGIIASGTFGLRIQHVFQSTINSDQLFEPQRLILAIHRVLNRRTNFVTILVV
jgi:hypothetical protein